ncbi:MAG: MarR family transcriptional regulator [Salinarimonas sp.]|nr:MarR family transcriptional regulator [Salinarimonas sp.]
MRVARLHRARMGEKLVGLGLYPGQEQVLQALAAKAAEAPGSGKKSAAAPEGIAPPVGMSMGELASVLQVRPPTASKTVSRLSALGLVARQERDGDRRVVRVALTEAGLERAEAISGLWDAVEDELLDGFDGKDRKRLRKLLRKAGRNLARLAGADDPDLANGAGAVFEDDDEADDTDSVPEAQPATMVPQEDPVRA